jgi:simple sugar transport system permease protein
MPVKFVHTLWQRYKHKLPYLLSPLLAVCLAILLGGCILWLTGYAAISVYASLFSSAFFDSYGLSETLVRATPILLCSLAVAICLHSSLWNIGAEGQMLLGCLTSTWVALSFPGLPWFIMLPCMMAAGFAGGSLWAATAGFLRSRFNVSEILTTLLMNYIAIELVNYFVYGPWKDTAGGNFPNTRLFPEAAWLSSLSWGRLHTGCFIALSAAIVVYLVLKYTPFGFAMRVVGDNVRAAVYAGIDAKKTVFITLFLAGGLAGIAGFVEMAGIEHKLHHRMPKGYGYMAIIIAWLAHKHPLWIIPVSFLLAGLAIGGEMVQITHNVPRATVHLLEGTILLSVLLSEVMQDKLSRWFG